MGCRILHDRDADLAVLYCSTSDVAFGPVFTDSEHGEQDASERAAAFLRWLPCDPRRLDEPELLARYQAWLVAEPDQYRREHPPTCVGCGEPIGTCDADCPALAPAASPAATR
jgi:hypothetical protein